MTRSMLDFSSLFDDFLDPCDLGRSPATRRDNADPHPVILTVHPREWVIPYAHQWDAEYEIEVEHPATCTGHVEDCPVQDYLDAVGIDESMYAAFPEPDHLTDAELAVLDGTVRYVVMSRWGTSYETDCGTEYDADYDFTWGDTDEPQTEPQPELRAEPQEAGA